MCPKYINKIYKTTNQNNTATRSSSLKLFQPLRTTAESEIFVVFRAFYLEWFSK